MKLWLDDVRPAPDGWTWAKTAGNAIDLINLRANDITDVSLDHDLGASPSDGLFARGSHERNGQMVARHIAGYGQLAKETPIRIHSWNPGGARIMAHWLEQAGYTVDVRPFVIGEAA